MLVKIDGEEREVGFEDLCNLIENDYSLYATSVKVYEPKNKKAICLFRLIDNNDIDDKSGYTEIKIDEYKSVYIRTVVIDKCVTSEDEEESYLSDALEEGYNLKEPDECVINTIPYYGYDR